MSLRFHEIAETYHRILNPFTEDQLMLLGEICHLHPGMKQLDLACGKAEMLCRWVQQYGISGVRVDISSVFLDAAKNRAAELGVTERLRFVQGDAGKYPQATHDDVLRKPGSIGKPTFGVEGKVVDFEGKKSGPG